MMMLWALQFAWASQTLQLAQAPIVGEPVLITVVDGTSPMPGETVRVFHRPGIAGEVELAVGLTDRRGQVEWTPKYAGVARLQTESANTALVVEGSAGAATLLTLVLLLLAGVLIAVSPLLRSRP